MNEWIWVNTAVVRFFKSTYYIIFLNIVEYITRHKLPVCTIMCLRRFTVSVNPRPQWGQRYGFSPVWVRWCVLRLCDAMKPFPQSWHTNGLSPTGNNNASLKYSAINAYKLCMKSCHPGRIQTQMYCLLHTLY